MNKLLIVVDYQNDFVNGSLGFAGAQALEEAICEKIQAYQKAGDDVVCTLDTHGEDYSETQEGRKLPIPHCLRNTQGWQLYGKTAELLKDCRKFEKPVFGSAELFEFLQHHKLPLVSAEHCQSARKLQFTHSFLSVWSGKQKTPPPTPWATPGSARIPP